MAVPRFVVADASFRITGRRAVQVNVLSETLTMEPTRAVTRVVHAGARAPPVNRSGRERGTVVGGAPRFAGPPMSPHDPDRP